MDEEYKKRIRKFYDAHTRMPSYAELMRLVGFSSRASAFKLIARLAQEKFLHKDRSGKLAPGEGWSGLRMLGLVEAGFPSPAEQEVGENISLDEYLIPNRDASFLLRVKGDSMKDAGIMEGDTVIVERTGNAKSGEIVVAEIDGEWTMKYYRIKGGKPYLEAANTSYKPMFPKRSLKITAVVRAVVRKY